ncbi:MAG: T9SS type A sorting domain-containing protein [Bacteroidota bacterium]
MRKFTLLLCCQIMLLGLYAQTGCPDCTIDLPEIPEDTIFLGLLPDGALGESYDADVSFRLPKTTTPVAERDSTVIAGLKIDEIFITGIEGLPAGLSWEANQDTFSVADLTDGCAKICGIPQERGAFRLEVRLKSRIFVVTQESSAFLDLFIAPPLSATRGFSMQNNVACGATRVSFRNNNPSQSEEGFSYCWDFGNGKTSTEENPEPQDYFTPGEYEVNYKVIIDTAQSRLTAVTLIEGSNCNDLIGRPDYYISIIDPSGEEIYLARHFENPVLPVTFELNIPLEEEGTYLLQVNDEDSGLEGSDDNCALIPFTFQDSLLSADGVVASLEINNPIDTILAADTVFVFPFPASPSIAVSLPDPFCVGTSASLKTTPYEDNLQWSRDGEAIIGATSSILEVRNSGRYTVSYTALGGCTVAAMPVDVVVNELPVEPIFENTDNLLNLLDESILNENTALQWYLDDVALEGENSPTLCATTSGNYTLEIVDNSTGCINSFSQEVAYDSEIINCNISSVEKLILDAFRLYPNPTSDWMYISFSNPDQRLIDLRVVDVLGRIQLQQQIIGNQRFISLDLSNLASGVYWLQFSADNRMLSRKIMKQ